MRSRRPHRHANQLPMVVEKTIVKIKREYPHQRFRPPRPPPSQQEPERRFGERQLQGAACRRANEPDRQPSRSQEQLPTDDRANAEQPALEDAAG